MQQSFNSGGDGWGGGGREILGVDVFFTNEGGLNIFMCHWQTCLINVIKRHF